MSVHIDQELMDEIHAHGQEHYPEEGAGILLGEVGDASRRVMRIIRVENAFQEDSRHNRYRIDPREMLDAELEAERLGLEVIGVFHSHPDHPARPSEFDRAWALPWYSYLITSVQSGQAHETRCWRLSENRARFNEEPLNISPKEQETA
jgi:proteasome lid subunit RPN8/RPN11